MTNPISDAEWAAREAIAALQDGRYKLGAALAALAVRAQHQADNPPPDAPAGVRSVPLIGSTREEHPARVDPTSPAPIYDTARLQVVPADVDTDVTNTALTDRCRWTIQPGVTEMCWQGIYWDGSRWLHVDPKHDASHQATPAGVEAR